MTNSTHKKRLPPPLTDEKLRELALRYVGKYATSEAKLARYLARKVNERGWDGEGNAKTSELAREFAELNYVDDQALAQSKARAAIRKGHGARRLSQQLYHDGISEHDSHEAIEQAHEQEMVAADNFARKKRIGPYAENPADENKRKKQLAAFIRAGHNFDLARKFVDANAGDVIE